MLCQAVVTNHRLASFKYQLTYILYYYQLHSQLFVVVAVGLQIFWFDIVIYIGVNSY